MKIENRLLEICQTDGSKIVFNGLWTLFKFDATKRTCKVYYWDIEEAEEQSLTYSDVTEVNVK